MASGPLFRSLWFLGWLLEVIRLGSISLQTRPEVAQPPSRPNVVVILVDDMGWAGWQIRMGLIDPRWPLTPREPDTPAWDSLSEAQKDRFDQLMSVCAAMIDAIDTSVGTPTFAGQPIARTQPIFWEHEGTAPWPGPALMCLTAQSRTTEGRQ